MATNFTQAKAELDAVAVRTTSNSARLQQARDLIDVAVADLTAMPSDTLALRTFIDTESAANPTDEAWINIKAEKDLIVTDFQGVKATADALNAAVDAIP